MFRTRRPAQGRTAVYELYDAFGELLYVGVTNSPRHRFAQHAADKFWWGDVDPSQTRMTWFETRQEALRVERRRIRSKGRGTVHNHIHNPRRGSPRARGRDRVRSTWSERYAAVGIATGSVVCGEWAGWWDLDWPWSVAAVCTVVGAGWLAWKLRGR